MLKELLISEIVVDAGTQVRAAINDATVTDYAEAMAEGAAFPPVIVFQHEQQYLMADGFHRVLAAIENQATTIAADVREGTRTDCIKFALSCNVQHGLRRTNLDKRQAVKMALTEFPNLSDRALAELCLVGNDLVGELRKDQLSVSDSCEITKRIGLDGRARRLPPPPVRPAAAVPTTEPPPVVSNVPTAKAVIPPPPNDKILDGTDWPIPAHLIPFWRRADEAQELLTDLSRVKSALREAQDSQDKLFAEVNFSSAQAHLDQAKADINTAKPYAVCPTCQGQLPDQCALCKGRGFLSEHRWDTCVSREDKEFRFKAKGKT